MPWSRIAIPLYLHTAIYRIMSSGELEQEQNAIDNLQFIEGQQPVFQIPSLARPML